MITTYAVRARSVRSYRKPMQFVPRMVHSWNIWNGLSSDKAAVWDVVMRRLSISS